MINESTYDGHPHHIWCNRHNEAGDGVLVHLGEWLPVGHPSQAVVELSLERATSTDSASAAHHQSAPRVRISLPGVGDADLSLDEAELLRAELYDVIRLGQAPEIPAGADAADDFTEPAPAWCGSCSSTLEEFPHPQRHHGPITGPHDSGVTVRRTRPYLGNAAAFAIVRHSSWANRDLVELAAGDSDLVEMSGSEARSVAAALLRVADEIER